jgi:hypothetical protein
MKRVELCPEEERGVLRLGLNEVTFIGFLNPFSNERKLFHNLGIITRKI